ncbi:MAG TPA: ATP-dependent metallopeptidase FtsH/Yme1/Tma family protein [Candidatus Angelobacter sp.]|nr:ATP-dependent metallopeptidase FtsH/Yme1/Tma family protein [Candidatus Angelobacter sp.]
MNSSIKTIILWLVLLLTGLVLWRMISSDTSGAKTDEINYTQFKALVDQDKVAKVTIEGNDVHGEYKHGDRNHAFHLKIQLNNQETYRLLEKAQDNNVQVGYRDSQSGNWWIWLAELWPIAVAFLVFVGLLAQLKLFSIHKTVKEILQELKRRDSNHGQKYRSEA